MSFNRVYSSFTICDDFEAHVEYKTHKNPKTKTTRIVKIIQNVRNYYR